MLSFDDEIIPAPAPAAARPVPPAAAPSFAPAPVSSHSEGSMVSHSTARVSAVDKRIINGTTDVNQLVPFKYKWAWENTSPPAPTTGCRRK